MLNRTFPGIFVSFIISTSGVMAAPVQWNLSDGGNGHFYEAIFVQDQVTWAEASSILNARSGDWHLATVTSLNENSFIYSLIDGQQKFFTQSYFDTGPWLGGFSSTIQSNDWQWVTGESFSYTNWGPFEPFNNGDRLAIFGFQPQGGTPSTWDDIPGSQKLNAFIAEATVVPVPPAIWLFSMALASIVSLAKRGPSRI